VQLPEGLKREALQIASIIEESGAVALISADPCYGACDLALYEAESLSADIIVHYGHAEMAEFTYKPIMPAIPIIYIEARANIPIREAVEDALKYLKPWRKIGLTTTVQHIHNLNEAEEILKRAGKEVYIGHVEGLKYPGQVLGCNYRNAKSISSLVDAFLFLGGGRFHALGLFLATMKPTVAADPFEGRACRVDGEAEKIIHRRWMDISEASKANMWGIIVGLKTGQLNIEAALRIKNEIEHLGRKAALLAIREITPEALLEFPAIEAYVNTACPRISLYDTRKFPKPMLTIKETYVAIGKISWNEILESGLL
jgi:2-(3-amino-3-carboxypropyl)histidine synthase